MTNKGLYTNINEFDIYMPDAITLLEVLCERRVSSGCGYFDKQKRIVKYPVDCYTKK